jgi:hypothetical protein
VFRQTVSISREHPALVFIQPAGDCNGLCAIADEQGFDVRELQSGTSSVEFSYRVVAKRRGYEEVRLPRAN